jgi:nucleoside 2-deoxyribosyltransferase
MLIYFAGPLFSEAEKRFNADLTEKLEALGFQVFLPQRDGPELNRPGYDQLPREERRRQVFELDARMVMECDVFLIVLDGRVPDEGACVELGIAYAHRVLQQQEKRLIGLHTDARAAFIGSKLNPMLGVPLELVAESEEALLEALRNFM